MKHKTDSSKSTELQKDGHVKKLAVIGAGKLGEGLLSGVLGSQLVPVGRVVATVAHQQRAEYLAEKYGIRAGIDNAEAVSAAGERLPARGEERLAQGCAAHFRRRLRDYKFYRACAAVSRPRRAGHAQHAVPDPSWHDCTSARQERDGRGPEDSKPRFRLNGPHCDRGRKAHGCDHGTFRFRARVRLHHHRISGGSGSETGPAERAFNRAFRSNAPRRLGARAAERGTSGTVIVASMSGWRGCTMARHRDPNSLGCH